MKIFLSAMLFATIIFTAGCGGGGGGSSENTNTYDLESFSRKTFKADIAGSMSRGGQKVTFTGFGTQTYEGKGSYEGKTVDIMKYQNTMYFDDGSSSLSETTSYKLGGIDLYNIDNDGVECYLSNSPAALPNNAKVGYSSDLITLNCSDLSSGNFIYEVRANGSTNAKIILTTELYENGAYVGSGTDEYIVDPNMNVKSVNISGIINGININFHSTAIYQ